MISDQIALHSGQLPLFIVLLFIGFDQEVDVNMTMTLRRVGTINEIEFMHLYFTSHSSMKFYRLINPNNKTLGMSEEDKYNTGPRSPSPG